MTCFASLLIAILIALPQVALGIIASHSAFSEDEAQFPGLDLFGEVR